MPDAPAAWFARPGELAEPLRELKPSSTGAGGYN
jgi:hypothetical protein